MWRPLLPSATEKKACVGKKRVDKFSRRTRTAQPPSLPRKEATLWDNEHPQNDLHAPPTFFHPNSISALLSTSAELRTHDTAFTSTAF